MRNHSLYGIASQRSRRKLQPNWRVFFLALAVVAGIGALVFWRQSRASQQSQQGSTNQEAVLAVVEDKVPRVGLQVGHWKAADLPDELSKLSWNFGASSGGVNELDVNMAIATKVKTLLERDGIIVDLLPATIPPNYEADAFVSFHADGNEYSYVTGYKVAGSEFDATGRSELLATMLDEEYGKVAGLPQNETITDDMTQYYAFNFIKYENSIASQTPAAILELGFITNAYDRSVITTKQDVLAAAIAKALQSFVEEKA
jgi:N-acetylmuramoyl-L-alanine amidase